jgi:hypothetical protein
MPRTVDEDDEWDEGPDDDDEDDTIPCPYCKKEIYEGAEQCPHCGQYISEEDAPLMKPAWIVVGGLICLAIVVYWVWGG